MPSKTVLAIDPGTHCGWCVGQGSVVASGVWNLKGGRHEGGGMRYVHLLYHLRNVCAVAYQPDIIVYEEVRGHKGTDAAQIYGGIIATITAFCEEQHIPYEGIPVGTIKKYATGKGNASKQMMVEAAQARWPDANIIDDNEADARWLWAYAETIHGV